MSLRARSEPYFMVVERGLSLGYRKSREGGSWLVRRYDPGLRRHTETRVGTADDSRDADGIEVLSFAQAQRKALAEAHLQAERAGGKHYTVADAVREYLDHLGAHGKSAGDAAIKLSAYVPPELGARRLAELKPADFDAWLEWAMKRQFARRPRRSTTPRRRRRSAAKGQRAARRVDAAEQKRRRKATINRVIAMLKACLNHAHGRHRVASREAWARLKKFRAVDSARLRWLSVDETRRLLNACSPDLRALAQAGLLTGCREGELLAVRARDFDATSQSLLIPDSKSGRPRRVPLTAEGVALFESLAAGREPDALLLMRKDGSPWHRVAVIRAMQVASAASKIDPPATFYTLRHTYASHLVQAGTPLLYVASALGHRDARMVERHYGHFAPSQVAATIRANLPAFGVTTSRKVRGISSRRGSSAPRVRRLG
ncbi:MAG: site-specific integrase [Steroidobacteraceae bacterium]